jgi:D-serine deaminase-like pyridoxal phosphate-dependent protein
VRPAGDKGPNADLIGVPDAALTVVTPALMLDLGRLRANLGRMREQCVKAGIELRPHGKTHKCSRVSREQLEYGGARGVCAATPYEAIAFAESGVTGILITAPVVQPRQLRALAELHAGGADISVVVDHQNCISTLEPVLNGVSRPMPALVDIDIGMGRTGASSPEQVVTLARMLQHSSVLDYAGVQAYSGRVQHIEIFDERRRVYDEQLDRLEAAITALRDAALAPKIISGGGTGTFAIDVERALYTETQAGSYIFMDVEYNAVELFRGGKNPYATSLFLRTSVLSANIPGQATLNAGYKSFATDGPTPEIFGDSWLGSKYEFFGDEYGKLILPEAHHEVLVGSTVDVVTPHCDPTVNLHDFYHVIDANTLIDVWRIDARGVL